MKAAQYSEYGDPSVIKINEIPQPVPQTGQVLVENRAASINPFDFKVRRGYLKEVMPLNLPITIGGDFSGRIIELGNDVKDLKVGDEIYGHASVFGGASGSMAEFLVANPHSITIKPANLNFNEAASMPLAGASAIQAIEDHLNLQPGQKILINGGGGGIGSIAIQIAKKTGAYIATTVSTENAEFAKSLGADIVIDYKKENFWEKIKEYDAVFDTTGNEVDERLLEILHKGGVLVSMTSKSEGVGEKYGVEVISQNSEVTTERLNRLRNYIEQEIVKPQIDKIFPLDEASVAYAYQETQKIRGKVVIKIKE